nr:MAG TPA: hypothetical protein [Caudoviricetes sp.]
MTKREQIDAVVGHLELVIDDVKELIKITEDAGEWLTGRGALVNHDVNCKLRELKDVLVDLSIDIEWMD